MSYFTYRQHKNRGYGWTIITKSMTAKKNCEGSNVIYGPSGCSSCCDGYSEYGMDVIQTLQMYLNTLGYLSAQPTGKYGSQTYSAVTKFQEDFGLEVDGRIGPNTSAMLYQQAEKVRANQAPPPAASPPSTSQAAAARDQAGAPAAPAAPAGLSNLPITQKPWFWPVIGGSAVALTMFIWWRRRR